MPLFYFWFDTMKILVTDFFGGKLINFAARARRNDKSDMMRVRDDFGQLYFMIK